MSLHSMLLHTRRLVRVLESWHSLFLLSPSGVPLFPVHPPRWTKGSFGCEQCRQVARGVFLGVICPHFVVLGREWPWLPQGCWKEGSKLGAAVGVTGRRVRVRSAGLVQCEAGTAPLHAGCHGDCAVCLPRP